MTRRATPEEHADHERDLRKHDRPMPYVCQASEVPEHKWAGDWLLVTIHGTSAHRTRDGAYSALDQYRDYHARKITP